MDDIDLGQTLRGFSAGQKVFGRYTLERLLGRGGMGVVWLARDGKLDRDVALKYLPEAVAQDSEAIDDLKRETRRALELTHPRIVRIYDFVDDSRTAAVAMEYVAGSSLGLLKLEQPQKCFTVAALTPWVKQLCEALEYAHTEAKIVHRDLKPANLMVDARGDLKIADFGISATISDTTTRVSKEASNSGTPVYMSPQQMMGEKPAATDDIYSLGATLYELLTGKPPFYTGNIVVQVQSKVPPSLATRREELGVTVGGADGPGIPQEWEETIAACLAKDPAQRPQSAADVWLRINRVGVDLGRERAVGTQQSRSSSGTTPTMAVPTPGKDWTVPGVGIEMIWIEPGSFVMGSPECETGRRADETQHRVMLTKGFWLGKYPVTQRQWQEVMGRNPSYFVAGNVLKEGGWFSARRVMPDSDNCPVEQVSWDDSFAFCESLSDSERVVGRLSQSFRYRLPTDAQWEFACRGGTIGPFGGNDNLNRMGWYADNSSKRTQTVGQAKPNAYGLCDMHGNVWEWCLDWYSDYTGAMVSDPVGPSSGTFRVRRGGSWCDAAKCCRSASRGFEPVFPKYHIGFRLALSVVDEA